MADPRTDHDTHDLEAIAALADDRTDDAAARRESECTDCTVLLDDLRLLARANATLTVPARTRDFRLDPAQVARLIPVASEPEAASSRPGWDMTSPAPDHATHEPVLIAGHLDGTLDPTDLALVDRWLAGCGTCATLRDDMAALVAATRTMPTPARPRDFSLSHEDARRARSSGWRRFMTAFGSPRDTFSRPLAVGLTTLGIAGLVVANIPTAMLSTTGAASSLEMTQGSAAPAYQEGAPAAAGPSDGIDMAGGEPGIVTTGEGAARASDAAGAGNTKSTDPEVRDISDSLTQADPDPTSDGSRWLVVVSGALLVVGLTLVMLRWRARRLGDG